MNRTLIHLLKFQLSALRLRSVKVRFLGAKKPLTVISGDELLLLWFWVGAAAVIYELCVQRLNLFPVFVVHPFTG